MPKFTGKTYGRREKPTESSKAFDDVMNSKVTGAKARFGVTSFTSVRGSDADARKRKIEEESVEETGPCLEDGTDSASEDPFNFDSDDDGPTQPKRGMGFKVDEKPKRAPSTKTSQKNRSNKLKKDENNDEKDTMKQAPTKTYSKSVRPKGAQAKNSDKSKQLSMDNFATKLGNNSSTNKVFRITLKSSNKSANNDSANSVPKKFFTSSQKSTISSLDTMSNRSSTPTEKGSELFESASDFEYDSDELAKLDSGDPEIIFNSPQRRRREAEKRKRNSLGGASDSKFVEIDKSEAKQRLFTDVIEEGGSSNVNKKAKTVNVVDDALTASASNNVSSGEPLSASELFDIAMKPSSRTESPKDKAKLSASELFDIAIKKSESVKNESPKKERANVSELFKTVVVKTKIESNGKKTETTASQLFDQAVKKGQKQPESKIGWKPSAANAFDDSDDDNNEAAQDNQAEAVSDISGNSKIKSSPKTKNNKKSSQSNVKNNKQKKKMQSSNLFEDSDDGNDTDDISSSQTYMGMKSYNMTNQGQSRSLDSKVSPPSKFFPELKRSVSVESTGSSGSGVSGDRLKKSTSLCNKLLNLEMEREKKKGPIVRRLLTSPKKGGKVSKAMYNVRSWNEQQLDEDEQANQPSQGSSQTGTSSVYDEFGDNGMKLNQQPGMKRLLRKPSSPYDDDITTVKVHKEHKQLFTVVRQVKQAHECHEHGENQDFNDELEYIMDGLQDTQPVSVRCLSCMNMTIKCTQPSFRMHLRAHGTFDKVFSALHNAHEYPTLALCTASVLYLLSRDRFSMDLEKSTLTLMLRLLSSDSQEQSPNKKNTINRDYQQVLAKIDSVFKSLRSERNSVVPNLDLESITTGHLTMESLLSLTSKKAGDWFKEELRLLGGLDHIIKTVSECTDDLDEVCVEPTETMLEQLRKVERCLRVLENVTYLNSENQNYLVSHKSCLLVKSIYKTLSVCENCLTFNPLEEIGGKLNKECIGYILWSTLLAILRVLLNLTHDNAYTSTKVGQQEGLVRKVLISLLRIPQYVPSQQRFDLLVLSLGFLINVVEHCEHNRDILIETKAVCPYDETSPISKLGETMDSLIALSKLFLLHYEAAKRIEVEHDEELDERERLQQERAARASRVGPEGENMVTAANKSGEWKHSESGMEWVVLEETEEERLEKELQRDSDSEMDVEVIPNPSQDEEENFTKALHRAGRHMEDCILAAYVALLLGCTIQGNMDHIDRVRDCLPEGDFEPMIRMLRKFLGFMNFTATAAVSQSSGSKSISRIIEVLEAC